MKPSEYSSWNVQHALNCLLVLFFCFFSLSLAEFEFRCFLFADACAVHCINEYELNLVCSVTIYWVLQLHCSEDQTPLFYAFEKYTNAPHKHTQKATKTKQKSTEKNRMNNNTAQLLVTLFICFIWILAL